MNYARWTLLLFAAGLGTGFTIAPKLLADGGHQSANGAAAQQSPAPTPQEPTAAELSRNETPGNAVMREFEGQEYEVRSAAEAMPADKWGYGPAPSLFKEERPAFGPAEVRTFAEQVKHVACSNFAFAAELDGATPLEACDRVAPVRQRRVPSCSPICATPSPR